MNDEERRQIKADAEEWAAKQMEYTRAGEYPPPRDDAEMFMSIEEIYMVCQERAKALKEARRQLGGGDDF